MNTLAFFHVHFFTNKCETAQILHNFAVIFHIFLAQLTLKLEIYQKTRPVLETTALTCAYPWV